MYTSNSLPVMDCDLIYIHNPFVMQSVVAEG